MEALAYSVAKTALEFAAGSCEHVTVRASKPSALVCAEAAEVEITRSFKNGSLVLRLPKASGASPQPLLDAPSESSDPQSSSRPMVRDGHLTACASDSSTSTPSPGTSARTGDPLPTKASTDSAPPSGLPRATKDVASALSQLTSELSLDEHVVRHKAAIAIGSNLGDRFSNIELALRLLETDGVHFNRLKKDSFVDVIDTSFMYETEPMYVVNQPKFINCACMVRLSPLSHGVIQ